jgi:ABC-type transport system substrate-binding protein
MRLSILIILLPVLITSCNYGKFPESGSTVFRYNESKGIGTLDPAFAREQKLIWPVNQIFNGLVQMDDSLNVLPCIASHWDVSDDGRVYTFYLRRDVFFHNSESFPGGKGRMVVAGDFEYSFRRIINPAVASTGRWIFERLEDNVDHRGGFKALNDSVFRIWLNQPFPPFPGMLTMPYCYVVPKEAVIFYGEEFGRNPVGTGPFCFKTWREDEKLILIKNSAYFEMDETGNRLPYLDAVAITFIKDKQSEFLEFLKGNLDLLNGIHPAYKDVLLTASGQLNPELSDRFSMISRPYLNTEYLGFLVDTTLEIVRQSPLSDINLRKAINYGFDRIKMMRYLRNNIGKPALSGFIPEGLPVFDREVVKGYTFNPDTAIYFLAKAGYPGGAGLPPIVLTTTSDYLDICEFIQFELSKIGIRINIEVATGASFRNKISNSNLNFFRGSWIADYPDAENYLSLFYSKNKSPAGPNYTQYADPVFDSLYIAALRSDNADTLKMLYNTMDKMIIEAAPVVPLFYDYSIRFISNKLYGLGSNPMNLLTLKKVNYRN